MSHTWAGIGYRWNTVPKDWSWSFQPTLLSVKFSSVVGFDAEDDYHFSIHARFTALAGMNEKLRLTMSPVCLFKIDNEFKIKPSGTSQLSAGFGMKPDIYLDNEKELEWDVTYRSVMSMESDPMFASNSSGVFESVMEMEYQYNWFIHFECFMQAKTSMNMGINTRYHVYSLFPATADIELQENTRYNVNVTFRGEVAAVLAIRSWGALPPPVDYGWKKEDYL